jgi:hypothetical protein
MSDGKLDSKETDYLDHMIHTFHRFYSSSVKIKRMRAMREARSSGEELSSTEARKRVERFIKVQKAYEELEKAGIV